MILIITGLSGSGKSVTAKEIANNLNAEHIQLDQFTRYLIDGRFVKSSTINEFIKLEKPEIGSASYKSDPNRWHDRLIEYLDKSKKNYVIEGIQIFSNNLVSYHLITKYSIMKIDSKWYQRIINRTKRNIRKHNGRLSIIDWIKYDGFRIYHIKELIQYNKFNKITERK